MKTEEGERRGEDVGQVGQLGWRGELLDLWCAHTALHEFGETQEMK